MSLQQGQRSNQGTSSCCTPTTPNQCPYQVPTFYTSNIKSRSHHNAAHLHPVTNVPTKFQLSPRQGHTMMFHTYTPNQCPYLVLTSYTLQFLRYSPDKLFPLPAHPDAMGENNTPTAIKGCRKHLLCFIHWQDRSGTVHSLGRASYFLPV